MDHQGNDQTIFDDGETMTFDVICDSVQTTILESTCIINESTSLFLFVCHESTSHVKSYSDDSMK